MSLGEVTQGRSGGHHVSHGTHAGAWSGYIPTILNNTKNWWWSPWLKLASLPTYYLTSDFHTYLRLTSISLLIVNVKLKEPAYCCSYHWGHKWVDQRWKWWLVPAYDFLSFKFLTCLLNKDIQKATRDLHVDAHITEGRSGSIRIEHGTRCQ